MLRVYVMLIKLSSCNPILIVYLKERRLQMSEVDSVSSIADHVVVPVTLNY
jgi:hypothetical protein